jgi:3-deoxy-D-manno-octulosonic-acid transferase
MENFQPLVQQLCNQKAIMMLDDAHALTSTLDKLENKEINTSSMTIRAYEVLSQHNHALKKTLELLEVNASVRNP